MLYFVTIFTDKEPDIISFLTISVLLILCYAVLLSSMPGKSCGKADCDIVSKGTANKHFFWHSFKILVIVIVFIITSFVCI